MGTPQNFSSLIFELKIIQVKNIKSNSKGNLFVRSYVPLGIGNNKRSIGLNTKEIPTTDLLSNDHVWDESFSLECSYRVGDSMDGTKLKQERLVFEVRMRKKVPVFGTSFIGSTLLGKSEVSLRDVLESPNMVFDKWVLIIMTRGHVVDSVVEGQPKLKVEISVKSSSVLKDEEISERRVISRNIGKQLDECGCKNGHRYFVCACDDYDVFALTTTSSLEDI